MAGHSKWKNIRLHKGKADQERAKLFARLSRDLTIAAKSGGGNPDSNPRLRLAIDKAKAGSMPADNVKRAIQKGTGELAGEGFEEIIYEGYGPGGVAVMVEAETNNRNRTVADVRAIFNKNGGSLGESGSVAWQFERKGQITIAGENVEEDELMLAVIEAGGDELENEGESFVVSTALEAFSPVQDALEAAGYQIENAELAFIPTTTIAVEGETATKLLKLLDTLEEYDDVQNVSANFEMSDEEVED